MAFGSEKGNVKVTGRLASGDGTHDWLKELYMDSLQEGQFGLKSPWFDKVLKNKKSLQAEGARTSYDIDLTPGLNMGNDRADIESGLMANPNNGPLKAQIHFNTGDDADDINIDNKFLQRGAGKSASFRLEMKGIIDRRVRAFGGVIARKAMSDGLGLIGAGVVTNGSGTADVVFTNFEDACYFSVGSRVQMVARKSTTLEPSFSAGVAPSPSSAYTVTAVDEDTGTVTLSGNWTAPSGCSATQIYLCLAGQPLRSNNAVGVAAWIPLTVPSSTVIGTSVLDADNSFAPLTTSTITCTHNRSLYKNRLAGHRITGKTHLPIQDLLYAMTGKMEARGCEFDHVLMSVNNFNKCASGAFSRFTPATGAEAEALNISTLYFSAANKRLPVIADANVADNVVYVLNYDDWVPVYTGAGIPFQDTMGAGSGGLFRVSGNAVALKHQAYWNLLCMVPYNQGVIEVDSTAYLPAA
jgi:hypothetical protein